MTVSPRMSPAISAEESLLFLLVTAALELSTYQDKQKFQFSY